MRLLIKEIRETPFISVYEREKRIFWNSLATKLEKHPIYGSWSVQEKHGILDTEWTLKFTELLKVDAQKMLVSKANDAYQRSIAKNIDKLQKSDFERMTCYNRIERLNKVTIKTDEIGKSIEREENCLHEFFSKLKLAQADLVKCLCQPKADSENYNSEDICDDSSVDEDGCLTQEQIDKIATQTKVENEITSDD